MHRGGDTAGGAGGLLRCHLPPLEQSPSCTGAAEGTWEVKGGKKLLPAWYEDGMVWSRCSFLGSLGLDRAGDRETAAPNLWKQITLCSQSSQGCHLQPHPMGALWALSWGNTRPLRDPNSSSS